MGKQTNRVTVVTNGDLQFVGWKLCELWEMPLRQFMEECPDYCATRSIREERLSSEALSLDVLQEVAQDPDNWDYVAGKGTCYDADLAFTLQGFAEEKDIPCRSISVPNGNEAKDFTLGLRTHYGKLVDYAAEAGCRPSWSFANSTFWFVHPDIVDALETSILYQYLTVSPPWLLFKAMAVVRGKLSPAEHTYMLTKAAAGNPYAEKYKEYTSRTKPTSEVRSFDPPYLPQSCYPPSELRLTSTQLAAALRVSLRCLISVTTKMDQCDDLWHAPYVTLKENTVLPLHDESHDDDWDLPQDDESWDHAASIWSPEVIPAIKRHLAFPLAKVMHGNTLSKSERRRMEFLADLTAEELELAKEYIALINEREQK
jgi:hypothetical protein